VTIAFHGGSAKLDIARLAWTHLATTSTVVPTSGINKILFSPKAAKSLSKGVVSYYTKHFNRKVQTPDYINELLKLYQGWVHTLHDNNFKNFGIQNTKLDLFLGTG
ncbi:hypothetical protein ACJX0J_022286, partial [Zea mays]